MPDCGLILTASAQSFTSGELVIELTARTPPVMSQAQHPKSSAIHKLGRPITPSLPRKHTSVSRTGHERKLILINAFPKALTMLA